MDVPDVKGRTEILKVHARNKKLLPDVELEQVAMRTPGFSGADLANLLNEAAILTGRRNLAGISNKVRDRRPVVGCCFSTATQAAVKCRGCESVVDTGHAGCKRTQFDVVLQS